MNVKILCIIVAIHTIGISSGVIMEETDESLSRARRADDSGLIELRALVEQQASTIQAQASTIQLIQQKLNTLEAAQPSSFNPG